MWTEQQVCKQIVDSLLGSSNVLFDKSLTDEEILIALCSSSSPALPTALSSGVCDEGDKKINTDNSSSSGNKRWYYDTLTFTHTTTNQSSIRNIPIIFHLSLSTYEIQLSHITSKCLQGLLQGFCQLASHIHLCRLWASALTDKYLNQHPQKIEIASIQCSIHELILAIEQELCIIDARLAGNRSIYEKESPLLANTKMPAITLLTLYQRVMRRWQSLFQSMCHRILLIVDVIDIKGYSLMMLTNNISNATSAAAVGDHYEQLPKASINAAAGVMMKVPPPLVSKETTFYYCFGLLRDFETVLRQGSRIEPLLYPGRSAPAGRRVTGGGHELSLRLDLPHVENNATYLFTRKAFVRYLEKLLVMIMKKIWSTSANENQAAMMMMGRTMKDKGLEDKVAADRAVIHELCGILGKHSFLAPILFEIDCSLEDFEILSKFKTAKLKNNLSSKAYTFSKVKFLNMIKEKADALIDAVSAQQDAELSMASRSSVNPVILAKSMKPLDQYLEQGKLRDALKSYYVHIHGDIAYKSGDRTIAVQEFHDELVRLLNSEKVVKSSNKENDESSNENHSHDEFDRSQLWKNSSQIFPKPVLEQLMHIVRDVMSTTSTSNKTTTNLQSTDRDRILAVEGKKKSKLSSETTKKKSVSTPIGTNPSTPTITMGYDSTRSKLFFVPFFYHLHKCLLQPLREELHLVKKEAMLILQNDFLLNEHIYLLKNIFLLGKLDIYTCIRELSIHLVYFMNDNLISLDYIRSQRTTLFNSLRHSITITIEDIIPLKGLQYFSLFLPSFQEALTIRSAGNSNTGNDSNGVYMSGARVVNDSISSLYNKDKSSSHHYHHTTPSERDIDESMYELLFKQMKIELHYQWPLSIIINTNVINRFQIIQRFLLTMTCSKWLSEYWWKAIVARGGLFHVQSARKSSKVLARNKANTTMEDVPLSQSSGMIEIEEDILRAKRICQHGLTTFSHTMNTLHGFYLTTIHSNIWIDFEEKFLLQQDSVLLLKHGLEEIFLTKVELLIALFKDNILLLQNKCFKAFHELRFAMTSELYRQDSRSAVLIAYRMAEIAFQQVLEANEQLVTNVRDAYSSEIMKLHLSVDQVKAVEELQYLL